MGLFDELQCRAPLPSAARENPPPDVWWQTKDFDEPSFDKYIITEGGRLICTRRKIEVVEYDTDFHGDLGFYHLEGRVWWEYRARFTEGQLARITLIDFSPTKWIKFSPPKNED